MKFNSKALVKWTLGLVGVGVLWFSFNSIPPPILKMIIEISIIIILIMVINMFIDSVFGIDIIGMIKKKLFKGGR